MVLLYSGASNRSQYGLRLFLFVTKILGIFCHIRSIIEPLDARGEAASNIKRTIKQSFENQKGIQTYRQKQIMLILYKDYSKLIYFLIFI